MNTPESENMETRELPKEEQHVEENCDETTAIDAAEAVMEELPEQLAEESDREEIKTADRIDESEECVKEPVAENTEGVPALAQTEKPSKLNRFMKVFFRVWATVLAALVLVLLSSVGTAFLIDQQWQKETDLLNEATQNRLNVLMERIEELEKNTVPPGSGTVGQTGLMTPAQVYNNNVQGVVAITAQITTTNTFGQVTEGESSGSGFIISADGYIVTNYHVVEGASALAVITHDSVVHEARLVGYDSTNDIAVLKVAGVNLPCVPVGSSDRLIVGDQVVAIGNPLGSLSSTLTVGYISAKDRMVTTTGVAINMLQTDAAINSGNSGGPLFNMAGEVVGITTAKYSGYSTSGASIEGIGFAIPIDDVIDMIRDLQEYGYITGPYLGVTVRDVSAALAEEYGMPLGTRVEEVVAGVSADRAGILPGDIIIDLGGYEIENISDLSRALRKFEAGDVTTITVFRSGREINLEITLDAKPPEMSTG